MKIYLAGPEVFDINALEIAEELKTICRKYGHEGLFPLDNVINADSKKELSKKIFDANIKMIKKADAVIANLNNWRGFEPDSGTIFEVGFAYALNKKVLGYIDNPEKSYLEKVVENAETKNISPFILDNNEKIIEDFDNPVNLMISESTDIYSSFEECVKAL